MPNEIEKKFKVKKLPTELLKTITPLNLTQTYLEAPKGEERRVRAINNEKFVMTVKRSTSQDGLIREEIEKEISKEDYELFLHQQVGTQIKKKRFKIPADNDLTYEVDIYEDDLDGLMVVEVEFPTEEMANSFEKPDWFGRDVTANKAYKNASLASKGMPKDAKDGFDH
jgi:CYTH domain-containing protein